MAIQIDERVQKRSTTNGNVHWELDRELDRELATELLWPVPPLESGDRLTRAEFERRYALHPEIKKAELIKGVVYVASPVRVRQHGEPHSRIITWLGVYLASTPSLRMADNSTYRLDEENEPQPDVSVWIDRPEDARAQIDEDDYLVGAPELLVEVAASTASLDLGDKQAAYARRGVQEYLVLQVYEQKTSWFIWRDGEYHEMAADAHGILCSRVFPGLWLDPQKFWTGDLAGLLAVLQQGVATPAHTTFVEEMPKQ